MSDTQGAPAPAPERATAQHPFFSCNIRDDLLFSVRAGIPANDALEQASSFLAAAGSTVYQVAEKVGGESAYAAGYLVEMAKAIVDAAIIAIAEERNSHG